MPPQKSIAILGSTGSIGRQALEVIRVFPDRFRVTALTAGRRVDLLAEQALEFRPDMVAIEGEELSTALENRLAGTGIRVLAGAEGVAEAGASAPADLVLSALVGIAGLVPTIAALEAGKPVALANKEVLVVGGEVVTGLARRQGVPIIPVDSEHSAIFQCLQGSRAGEVADIILTSSGGPFRTTPAADLAGMTAREALRHPTWRMGPKITIDSATLMNKGFEIIETRWLFGVGVDRIRVVVHPQSIVHSLVEFVDGSVLAQVGMPDMRLPIQYALGYPERLPKQWTMLDLAAVGALTFEEPRWEQFPCLGYAVEAGRRGGTLPAVLNGANEMAVALFLEGRIRFGDIARFIREAMDRHEVADQPDVNALLAADRWARKAVESLADSRGPAAAAVPSPAPAAGSDIK